MNIKLGDLYNQGYRPAAEIARVPGVDSEQQTVIALEAALRLYNSAILQVVEVGEGKGAVVLAKTVETSELDKPLSIKTNMGEFPLVWEENYAYLQCDPATFDAITLGIDQADIPEPLRVLAATTEGVSVTDDREPGQGKTAAYKNVRLLTRLPRTTGEFRDQKRLRREAQETFFQSLLNDTVESLVARELHEHNRRIIEESRLLRIRSGGKYNSVSWDDANSLYRHRLSQYGISSAAAFDVFVPHVVPVEDLQLNVNSAFIHDAEVNNPLSLQIEGRIVAVKYSLGEVSDGWTKRGKFLVTLSVSPQQLYTLSESALGQASIPSGRNMTYSVDSPSYKGKPTNSVALLKEQYDAECWNSLLERKRDKWMQWPEVKINRSQPPPTLPDSEIYNPGNGAMAYPMITEESGKYRTTWRLVWTTSSDEAQQENAKLKNICSKTSDEPSPKISVADTVASPIPATSPSPSPVLPQAKKPELSPIVPSISKYEPPSFKDLETMDIEEIFTEQALVQARVEQLQKDNPDLERHGSALALAEEKLQTLRSDLASFEALPSAVRKSKGGKGQFEGPLRAAFDTYSQMEKKFAPQMSLWQELCAYKERAQAIEAL